MLHFHSYSSDFAASLSQEPRRTLIFFFTHIEVEIILKMMMRSGINHHRDTVPYSYTSSKASVIIGPSRTDPAGHTIPLIPQSWITGGKLVKLAS